MSDDPAHWQASEDIITRKVRMMRSEGVKTLTWKADKSACDACAANNGKTVQVGHAFPSGALLTPEHGHCGCKMTDNMGAVYEWTGVLGVYKRDRKR